MCHSIWDLWSNLVWVNLIHLASSSWLTIPSAFSSILFQTVFSRIFELDINSHQGDIITCPQWPPTSSDFPQDLVHQTPPPGPRQGTLRGHSRGRGRRGAGWNQCWSSTSRCCDLLLSQREVSHEGPCHAPFHAPALAHNEPAKYFERSEQMPKIWQNKIKIVIILSNYVEKFYTEDFNVYSNFNLIIVPGL